MSLLGRMPVAGDLRFNWAPPRHSHQDGDKSLPKNAILSGPVPKHIKTLGLAILLIRLNNDNISCILTAIKS